MYVAYSKIIKCLALIRCICLANVSNIQLSFIPRGHRPRCICPSNVSNIQPLLNLSILAFRCKHPANVSNIQRQRFLCHAKTADAAHTTNIIYNSYPGRLYALNGSHQASRSLHASYSHTIKIHGTTYSRRPNRCPI